MKKKTITLTEEQFRWLANIAWAEHECLVKLGDDEADKSAKELQTFLNKLEAKIK